VLLGNHEELMLRALAGEPGLLMAWLRMGGDATLRSFGMDVPSDNIFPPDFLRQARAAIGPDLRQWLGGRPLFARSGDYFFCHAGVQPGVALARQKQDDLLWIREPFLRSTLWHGAVVVHGHSVEAEVQAQPNRIGIDTGAYRTGRLTALCLDGTQRFILTACEEELAARPESEA
jgi:serine/threonine protein phosphatase 1